MADLESLGLEPRQDIQQSLIEAQHRWLRPAEICEILRNHQKFHISSLPPTQPPSGSLFLFNRRTLRYFRKDDYRWRKKKDGRTVREVHETLKVGSDVLQCYCACLEDNENFQRRSYWVIGEELLHIVFVHYLEMKDNQEKWHQVQEVISLEHSPGGSSKDSSHASTPEPVAILLEHSPAESYTDLTEEREASTAACEDTSCVISVMVTTVAESVAGTAAKAPAANFMSERHKNEEVDDVSSTSSEKGNHGLVPFSKPWTSEILYGRLYNICLPWHLVHLCLADCNIRDANIPYDHLWSLEQLDLRGNLMCSLPKSVGSLNTLQRLWLDHCTSLQSLPELPKNLEMLSVRDCLSLEISSPFFLLLSQPHPLLRCSLLDVITNHDDDPFEFYLNRNAYRRNPHECFVSLSVLERMMPGGVEKLQSLTRLRKRGVFGFCQFKAKADEQIFRIDGQRVEQNLTVPASLIGIESTSSVDILPCYLVELDLKDCNVSDEDSILKNITSLCSLKYLNLSGNLISYLPESIVKLAELKCLKMSRCKMLHSLPELPPGLEKLKLCHCSSLQKAVNLPNLFRSLQLDVRNCDRLVEIQELFILQTMENNDVEAVHNFRLLQQKSTGDIEISLFNFLTYSMRTMSLQILYECGIVSVYLPGRKVPYWFSYNMKGGSSQDLIVPSLVGMDLREM